MAWNIAAPSYKYMASETVRRAYKRTFFVDTAQPSLPVDPRELGVYRSVAEIVNYDELALSRLVSPITAERDPAMREDLLKIQGTVHSSERFLYDSYTGAKALPPSRRHKPSFAAAVQYDDQTMAERNVVVLAGKLEMDNFPATGAQNRLERDVDRNSMLLLARLLVYRRKRPAPSGSFLDDFALGFAIDAVTLARKLYFEKGYAPHDALAPKDLLFDPMPANEFADYPEKVRAARSDYDTAADVAKTFGARLDAAAEALKNEANNTNLLAQRLVDADLRLASVKMELDYTQRTRRSDTERIDELHRMYDAELRSRDDVIRGQATNETQLNALSTRHTAAQKEAVAAQMQLNGARDAYQQLLLWEAGPAAVRYLFSLDSINVVNESDVGDAVALIGETELRAIRFIGRTPTLSHRRQRGDRTELAEISAQRIEALRRSIAPPLRAVLQRLAGSVVLPFALSNDFVLHLESKEYLAIV